MVFYLTDIFRKSSIPPKDFQKVFFNSSYPNSSTNAQNNRYQTVTRPFWLLCLQTGMWNVLVSEFPRKILMEKKGVTRFSLIFSEGIPLYAGQNCPDFFPSRVAEE